MRILTLLLFVSTAFALTACGKPVPPEKSSYVGEWRSQTMALLITQDGSVEYKRVDGGVSKSINGPLKGFNGDNFEVGIGPMSTTFVVSSAPYQEDGKWKMTVEGVELTKAR